MPAPRKASTKRSTTAKKKPAARRNSSRLTKADMEALKVLDRLVEEDRRIEQKYDLPFRSPRQVAMSYQPCAHCHKDIAWLIFGDLAKDIAGLEAYARLMDDAIRQNNLPTYIMAPPAAPDPDAPALLLKVYPEAGEPGYITPPEWEALIQTLSDEHCRQPVTSASLYMSQNQEGQMPENEQEQKATRNNWNRPIAGPQQPGASHQVGVYGQGSEQAYSRRSTAKPVTFTCIVCGQEKTEYRYPGFTPRYCKDECRDQAAEERNRRRVAQQREKRQKARMARP